MPLAQRETEIAVRIDSETNELSALNIIAWHSDIEVLAVRSYCDLDSVVLLLVTTNPNKTVRILEKVGFRCRANPVVLIGPLTKPGMAAPVGAALTAVGINMLYSYTSRKEFGEHYLVVKTSEDERAIQAMETNLGILNAIGAKSREMRPVLLELGERAA